MLLDERGRLALADFGIARLGLEDQITQTGQVLGTAAYISPEQAMGEPATPASDRYALAVVAFELLTGRKPFQAENFAAQARAHVEDEPPPPRPSTTRCRRPSTACSRAAWPRTPGPLAERRRLRRRARRRARARATPAEPTRVRARSSRAAQPPAAIAPPPPRDPAPPPRRAAPRAAGAGALVALARRRAR